MYLCVHTVVVT